MWYPIRSLSVSDGRISLGPRTLTSKELSPLWWEFDRAGCPSSPRRGCPGWADIAGIHDGGGDLYAQWGGRTTARWRVHQSFSIAESIAPPKMGGWECSLVEAFSGENACHDSEGIVRILSNADRGGAEAACLHCCTMAPGNNWSADPPTWTWEVYKLDWLPEYEVNQDIGDALVVYYCMLHCTARAGSAQQQEWQTKINDPKWKWITPILEDISK